MAFNYSPKIVTDGLVFAVDAANKKSYPGSGTTWTDLAGSNNGTLTNGPTFDSGNGGSIVFDGVNDYVELGSINSSNPISLAGTTEQTWEAWIYPTNTGDNYQRIIDKSNNGGGENGYFFSTGATDERRIYCKIDNNASDMPNDFIADNMYTVDRWNHICVTRKNNTVNYGWNFYSNGVLKHSRSTINLTVPTDTTNCRIGTWNHSTSREFNGQISIVKLYNRALTSTEITQNYNALKGRFGL